MGKAQRTETMEDIREMLDGINVPSGGCFTGSKYNVQEANTTYYVS
jgi:hypothetical protein